MGKISWSLYRPKKENFYIDKHIGVYYRLNVQYYTLSGDTWVLVGSETLTNYPSGGLPPDNRNYFIWGNIINQKISKVIFRKQAKNIRNRIYDTDLDTLLGGTRERLGG